MASPNGNCISRALEQFRLHSGQLALWSPRDGSVSFAQLGEMAAEQQAHAEKMELGVGDVVIVMALPSPFLYSSLLAFLGLGCVVVFIEPWMPLAQVDGVLHRCNPKALCVDTFGYLWSLKSSRLRSLPRLRITQRERLKTAVEHFKVHALDSKQAAMISFTSGTTGQPKGVVRTHEYLWNLHDLLVKYGRDDVLPGSDLTIFPNLVLFNIGNGRASLLVPSNWSLNALEKIHSLDKELWPQSLSCGPAFLKRLLDYNLLFPSLKHVHVGGALIECDLLENALKLLPRSDIKQVYGGTEVEPVALSPARVSLENSRSKGYVHAIHLGFPIEELNTRLDEAGILWVSGPNVCPEYLCADEENSKNKKRDETGALWHCMGDRMLLDENGLWYSGRANQLYEDFLFEQKLYSKLGHSRACLLRGPHGHKILIADDERSHVNQLAQSIAPDSYETWRGMILRDRRHRSRIDRMSTWRKSLMMQRWWLYIKERSPLPILFILAIGPLVSGFFLSQVHGICSDLPGGTCLSGSPQYARAGLAIAASVIFMVLARMMDELKDFEKDKIANPNRPLPRGLISIDEMSQAIKLVFVVLVILSLVFLKSASPMSAILMLGSALYLWLMFKEFYVAQWLANYPLLYALSHQIVGIPLYLFGATLFAPAFASTELAWIFVGINVSSSIAYEFTRKINPKAHPAAKTYRQIYGLWKTVLIALCFQFAAMAQAFYAQKSGFVGLNVLIVLQGVSALFLLWQGLRDSLHKVSEGMAALVVLLAAWMGIFVIFRF